MKVSNIKSSGKFSIIWKYTIKPSKGEIFEHEYGSRGSWQKLFNTSKNYRGSTLYKNEEVADTYMLIDKWTNKKSYEDFIIEHSEIYDKMSRQFEYLYDKKE